MTINLPVNIGGGRRADLVAAEADEVRSRRHGSRSSRR
jgi:hypothetical protein